MATSDVLHHYLDRQWNGKLTCPLCGQQEWFTPPEGPHAIEGLPMSMSTEPDGWAPPVGVWLCICQNCGYVALLVNEFVDSAEETEEGEESA